jgi:uncharacterized membrane protein
MIDCNASGMWVDNKICNNVAVVVWFVLIIVNSSCFGAYQYQLYIIIKKILYLVIIILVSCMVWTGHGRQRQQEETTGQGHCCSDE